MRHLLGCIVLVGALFGASCSAVSNASIVPASSPDSDLTEPASAVGLVLEAEGFVSARVDPNRAAPTLPDGVGVTVFNNTNATGTLAVRFEAQPGESSSIDYIGADDATNCRAAVTIPGAALWLVFSTTEECESILTKVAEAIIQAKGDWRAIISAELPDFREADTSSGTITDGYAITYRGETDQVTLVVNSTSGKVSLAAIDGVASQSFVSRDETGGEYLLTHTFDNEPYRLVWLQEGFLVQLIGDVNLIQELRPRVTATATDPVAGAQTQGSDAIAASATLDEAPVGALTVLRKAGPPGSMGGACISSATSSACAEFSAVGSFASLLHDGTWYFVAVVPVVEPTTTYRTEPDLDFDVGNGKEWTFAIAVVPADIRAVIAFYSTTGLELELSTTWLRPSPGTESES